MPRSWRLEGRRNLLHECSVALAKLRTEEDEETRFLVLKSSYLMGHTKYRRKNKSRTLRQHQPQRNRNENISSSLGTLYIPQRGRDQKAALLGQISEGFLIGERVALGRVLTVGQGQLSGRPGPLPAVL